MKAIVSPLYFIYLFVLSLFIGFSIGSCSDNEFEELSDNSNATKVQTRAVPTPVFDWENADWMPTPSMQSRIPSPWSGQGSLVIGHDRTGTDYTGRAFYCRDRSNR